MTKDQSNNDLMYEITDNTCALILLDSHKNNISKASVKKLQSTQENCRKPKARTTAEVCYILLNNPSELKNHCLWIRALVAELTNEQLEIVIKKIKRDRTIENEIKLTENINKNIITVGKEEYMLWNMTERCRLIRLSEKESELREKMISNKFYFNALPEFFNGQAKGLINAALVIRALVQ